MVLEEELEAVDRPQAPPQPVRGHPFDQAGQVAVVAVVVAAAWPEPQNPVAGVGEDPGVAMGFGAQADDQTKSGPHVASSGVGVGEVGGEEIRSGAGCGFDPPACPRPFDGPSATRIRRVSRPSWLRGGGEPSVPEGARSCKPRTLRNTPESAREGARRVVAPGPSGRRGSALEGEESRQRPRRSADRSGKNAGKNWPDCRKVRSWVCGKTGMDCLDLLIAGEPPSGGTDSQSVVPSILHRGRDPSEVAGNPHPAGELLRFSVTSIPPPHRGPRAIGKVRVLR